MRGPQGLRGVVPRGDHAFLSEEAVQRVTEGREESRVQRPVTQLSLPHALQQVWKKTGRSQTDSRWSLMIRF